MAGRRIWERFVATQPEPLPGVPLVEIAGSHRVLIEQHKGVLLYEPGRICVRTRSGEIDICGECLVLTQMSNSQVVITGKIRTVELHDRRQL